MPKTWQLPSGIDPTAWAEFEQHRKEIRKPLKDLARTKNANILLKMTIPQQIEAIDTTIAHGWAGIFPPRPAANTFSQKAKPQDISNAFMEAFGTAPPTGKSVDECWQIYRQRKGNGSGQQWWNE